jgi:hypothetical protein
MSWTLEVEVDLREPILSGDHLRQRLLQLHEQAKSEPLFAVLNAPDRSTLAIGLGRLVSVLSYTAPGGWPAKHVKGDTQEDSLLSYKFLGHFTEVPSLYSIPLALAVDAAVAFFETGRLNETLSWETD